ncbi:menaquinone biosynthetic enzyme MqnA/MqnD family protein [Parafilimonas sp.]|uniref:menaquinone biosynthetic enzyme MqnA/MqnD family protein n=1 Tax=Parafilimonas sp. TaxID=1969739 RepID=UPI0039E3AD75
MKKIKVGAVSYLNTKPLLFGVERSHELMQQIELVKDYPSKIAGQLVDGDIDVGLVPVAVIPQLKEYHIVSDFCIGAEGDVASVCLFSDVEINTVEKVLLDYQSKTSVNLFKVLLKHYWQKHIALEDAQKDFSEDIKGTTAGVLIGDRALKQRAKSGFIYDLAGEWIAMSGLPFVFAAWIANKELPADFLRLFNEKNAEGINNIDVVLQNISCDFYDMRTYYTKNISYKLSEGKLKGMNLFIDLLQKL